MKKVIIYALVALGVFTLIISNLGTCSWGGTSTTVSDEVDATTEVLTDATDDDTDTSLDESEFDDEDGDYDIEDNTTDEDNSTASTNDEDVDEEEEITVAGNDDTTDDDTDVVLATNNSTSGSSSSSAHAGESSGKYLVVTGSFRMKENAEALAKKLRKRGYPNAEVVIFDYSEFYSVVAGRSNSESSATSLKNDLINDGIESYVHKMRSKYFK